MKHNYILILLITNGLLAVGLIFSLSFHWSSSSKIAYVQTNKLINEYQGMINAKKSYEQKAIQWQANVDTLASEWKQELNKYQAEKASMTAKERKLTEELITQKQRQLKDYQGAIQKQAEQEDLEMTQKVLDEVNTFLTNYGQSKGYEVILAATDMGNIAYAHDGLDLTEEVLKALNENYIP